jgi:hypothetical protein
MRYLVVAPRCMVKMNWPTAVIPLEGMGSDFGLMADTVIMGDIAT